MSEEKPTAEEIVNALKICERADVDPPTELVAKAIDTFRDAKIPLARLIHSFRGKIPDEILWAPGSLAHWIAKPEIDAGEK